MAELLDETNTVLDHFVGAYMELNPLKTESESEIWIGGNVNFVDIQKLMKEMSKSIIRNMT